MEIKTTEGDHESPNDIFCPNCGEYKNEYLEDTSPSAKPFTKMNRCPDCKSEVRIS